MAQTDGSTPVYHALVRLARLVSRIFFRRVELHGLEHFPERGGGLLVAWHPNALMDGILLLGYVPRQIVIGARHGLFEWPLLGWFLRQSGAVPIYRRGDAGAGQSDEERRARNVESLDAMARGVAAGRFAALFPEGLSHDRPAPAELKTGAARLFYRAAELTPPGEPPPVIVPAGLHYDRKRLVGSRALIAFHPPLELDDELEPAPSGDAGTPTNREQPARLTAELKRILHEVVHATESWELNQLLHRVRKLMRAERAARAGARSQRPDMRERVLGFARVWTGYTRRLATHPEEVGRLRTRVRRYDEDLSALAIEDHELDGPARLAAPPWRLLVQAAVVFFLMPPLLVLGYLVNLPTAALVLVCSRARSSLYKDEATLKVMLGLIAFPLTWLLASLAVAWGALNLHYAYPQAVARAPWLSATVTFGLCAIGGLLALHYHRLVRETARALRVRLTRTARAATVERLRKERGRIYDSLERLVEGVELPGALADDGRVLWK